MPSASGLLWPNGEEVETHRKGLTATERPDLSLFTPASRGFDPEFLWYKRDGANDRHERPDRLGGVNRILDLESLREYESELKQGYQDYDGNNGQSQVIQDRASTLVRFPWTHLSKALAAD